MHRHSLHVHRETKKKILGMRGEEWGKIVVDGTWGTSHGIGRRGGRGLSA